MTVTAGQKLYFLSGSPRGLVVGLRNEGKDDHLTLCSDDDEITQVHRKINGREDWRVTPESLQAEVDSFLANNASVIEPESLNPKGYIISLDKVNVAFGVFQSLLSIPLAVFLRMTSTRKLVRTESGLEGLISFEPNKIRHLTESARRPMRMLSLLARRCVPIILVPILKKVARHLLISQSEVADLGCDVALVVSDAKIGIIWQSEDALLNFVPLTSILAIAGRLERNQPFGKLNELATPDFRAIRFTAKSLLG